MLPRPAVSATVLLLLVLSACSTEQLGGGDTVSDETEPPELGACRVLTPEDVAEPSNYAPVVDCREQHNAQTFAVGTFPDEVIPEKLADDTDGAMGAYIYRTCDKKFEAFLGGDESTVMRSALTWAWFRPSEEAWGQGARWYRCDVVGGGEQSKSFVDLPRTAEGLLIGQPDDRWMICADGPTVDGSVKIPCSEEHTWRAVTTIKLGQPEDPYPGDRFIEVRTRDYCSSSVGAWLNYPVDYDFGYTYFHEAEWKAGNRRSICWARTEQ